MTILTKDFHITCDHNDRWSGDHDCNAETTIDIWELTQCPQENEIEYSYLDKSTKLIDRIKRLNEFTQDQYCVGRHNGTNYSGGVCDCNKNHLLGWSIMPDGKSYCPTHASEMNVHWTSKKLKNGNGSIDYHFQDFVYFYTNGNWHGYEKVKRSVLNNNGFTHGDDLRIEPCYKRDEIFPQLAKAQFKLNNLRWYVTRGWESGTPFEFLKYYTSSEMETRIADDNYGMKSDEPYRIIDNLSFDDLTTELWGNLFNDDRSTGLYTEKEISHIIAGGTTENEIHPFRS